MYRTEFLFHPEDLETPAALSDTYTQILRRVGTAAKEADLVDPAIERRTFHVRRSGQPPYQREEWTPGDSLDGVADVVCVVRWTGVPDPATSGASDG